MIIKKIIDICKKNGAIFLFDAEDEQWISDGFSVYPMSNLPRFDGETICKTYDITEKQADKIKFRHETGLPEEYSFKDYDPDESLCNRISMCLSADGKGIIPYMTLQGIAFIDARYLAPLGDIRNDMIEVYERHTKEGRMYFAAKYGSLILGLIMPYDCINESFVKELKTITEHCEVSLFNKKNHNDKSGSCTEESRELIQEENEEDPL